MADTSQTNRAAQTRIARVLEQQHDDLLQEWVAAQSGAISARGRISASDVRTQCREFLSLLSHGLTTGDDDVHGASWSAVREFLSNLSRSRAQQGFSPTDTAIFVFSLKEILFKRLRVADGSDADALTDDVWTITRIIDSLGLYTSEVFLKSREELIARQQQDMLELSTPVV